MIMDNEMSTWNQFPKIFDLFCVLQKFSDSKPSGSEIRPFDKQS